ncbi:MAG: hypothetical protein KJZ65_07860 [Phycisphaerales bacterium]|nr:hypothetical protein [Phycisphaerales bacterium]
MEEKVEQQTETRDMTERVEEMLSAIDSACSEIDRQTEGERALTPETVADVGAQLATDLAGEPSSEPEPSGLNEVDALNTEQSELADADAGFVLEDLIEPSEPEEAVNAAAEALSSAVESAEHLSNDIAAIADALADLKTGEQPKDVPATDQPQPVAPEGTVAMPTTSVSANHPEPQSIDELDSELASLAEAALQGTFEDPGGLATESAALPPQAVPAAVNVPPEPPSPAVEPSSIGVPEASVPAPQPEWSAQPMRPSVAAPPPPGAPPAPEPTEQVAQPEPESNPIAPRTSAQTTTAAPGRLAALSSMARVVEPGARKIWLAARPALASAVIAMSKPAEKLSASKRDTIGWFAVYTAFLAVCVWGFLLLFRKPAVPPPTSDPVGILGEPAASADS